MLILQKLEENTTDDVKKKIKGGNTTEKSVLILKNHLHIDVLSCHVLKCCLTKCDNVVRMIVKRE